MSRVRGATLAGVAAAFVLNVILLLEMHVFTPVLCETVGLGRHFSAGFFCAGRTRTIYIPFERALFPRLGGAALGRSRPPWAAEISIEVGREWSYPIFFGELP